MFVFLFSLGLRNRSLHPRLIQRKFTVPAITS